METPRFLSGKLLLAMPGIGDPRFERAVIALCVHDENGAVGIGIGAAYGSCYRWDPYYGWVNVCYTPYYGGYYGYW